MKNGKAQAQQPTRGIWDWIWLGDWNGKDGPGGGAG